MDRMILPPKKDVCHALLEMGIVRMFIDPRREGVVVPPWLKTGPQLLLDIGLNMPVPIRDLLVDDDGIACTLSFNRSPFYCVMPWTSIFALVGDGGRGMIWPNDVPSEVQMGPTAGPGVAAPEPSKQAEKKRHLHSVPAPPPDEPAKEELAVAKEEGTKKKPAKKKAPAKKSEEKPVVAAKKATAEKASAGGKKAAFAAEKKPAKRAPKKVSEKPSPAPPATVAAKVDKKPDLSKDVLAGAPKVNVPVPAPLPAQIPLALHADRKTEKPKRELPPYLRVVK